MRNHVDTVRFRLAVAEIGYEYDASDMPGAPQAGPQQNEVEQGRCAADVLSNLATMNNALSAAGFAATAVATAGCGAPKRSIMRPSISASRFGFGGSTAHANAAGEPPSILVVGTCSMPRCEM